MHTPSFVSYCCDTGHHQEQLEGRAIWLTHPEPQSTEGSLEGGADLQRPWRNAAYWLAPPGLLSLLIHPGMTYPRLAPSTVDLARTHQSLT